MIARMAANRTDSVALEVIFYSLMVFGGGCHPDANWLDVP
jgi:hypothetical protein